MTEGRRPKVVVAIPAYNEREGLAGFLSEIDRALAPQAEHVRLIVVDDASTDDTPASLQALEPQLQATLELVVNPQNQGHGPTLMTAYRRALATDCDFVLQVDGDGQFHGSDLRRILVLLIDQAQTVSGVRRFRQDPRLRMIMTALVRFYVRSRFSVRARDPNCPLRGYDAKVLAQLIKPLPRDCVIPNLYLTILAARRGFTLLEVDVSHRVRRGTSAQGTTWGGGVRSPIPWRLVRFSINALRESARFRAQMDLPDWARDDLPGEEEHWS